MQPAIRNQRSQEARGMEQTLHSSSMNKLEELLDTLTACQQALDAGPLMVHKERLIEIERLVRAMAPEEVAHGHQVRRRGGDQTRRLQYNLCRVTLDHSQDLISILDEEGKYQYVSPSHSSVLGYSPAYLWGTSAFLLVHPEDLRLANQEWERLRQKGYVRTTLRYRDARGAYRWLDVHGSVAKWGSNSHLVMVSRDISAQIRAEAAANASEERFRLLVESVKEYAIVMLDPDGCVTSWNMGAERIKGYSEAEIIGKHFSCFYPREAVGQCLPTHALRLAAAQGEFVEEGMRVRKDGSTFPARVAITPLYEQNGALRGFANVTRDISERKQAEDCLRGRFDMCRALLGALSNGFFVLNQDGIVLEAINGGDPLLPTVKDDLEGRHIQDVFPEASEHLSRLISAASRAGVPQCTRLDLSIDPDKPHTDHIYLVAGHHGSSCCCTAASADQVVGNAERSLTRKMQAMSESRLDQILADDPAPGKFAIVCDIPFVRRAVIDLCQARGFALHPAASNVVLLDLPYGFALRSLESLDRSSRRVIVVTWNTSAEYLEDLWALQPAILLLGQTMEVELPVALIRASQGDRYRCTAEFMTALAPPERAILRGVARALCNQQIADQLGIQEKTVRNILTTVYAKLGVDNRTQAALRYWGRQDLLD